MKKPALVLAVIAAIITLAPRGGFAAEGHAEPHHHHLALFAGWGTESKTGHEDHDGYAIGLEYEFRWTRHWGVGAVVEGLGQETVRNVLVVVPISFHPGGGWRLIVGPGVEFTPKKDKLAVRLGAGYIFHIGGGWGVAPEVFLDLIETGEKTWVAGVAVGYGF
jgi:hypothetical protein